jgi:hypothetical protein
MSAPFFLPNDLDHVMMHNNNQAGSHGGGMEC